MKWIRLTLETTTQALDYLGAICDEIGLEGFEIEDNVPLTQEEKESMFIDILPELPPDDGKAKVSFYVDEDCDVAAVEKSLLEAIEDYKELCDFGSMELTVSQTEDKDWINNWKEFFKPFRVDESIVIKPTWEEAADVKPDDIVVEIDPGTAFGTGAHETTKLCILNLKKYLKPSDKLLDVGCGSGILSIMGMKLGASCAVGIDVDDNASRIAVENTEINRIKVNYIDNESIVCAQEDKKELDVIDNGVRYLTGNVISDSKLREYIGIEKYDVVVANILADVIIPLSEVVAQFMKKDACFISSGIINTMEKPVTDALVKNGFNIVEVTHMKDWVSIVARLNR